MLGPKVDKFSRRQLLSATLGLGTGVTSIASCSKDPAFSCTDVSGLSVQQLQVRDKLIYRDRAAKPELACELCTQYVPPDSGRGCGTCKVMPGPTHPLGSCKVFARKA